MKAKEWLFKYKPEVIDDWSKTGHDDEFMARMMDEYHESQLKLLNIPVVSNGRHCDSCGCHPNVLYITSSGLICEMCKPAS